MKFGVQLPISGPWDQILSNWRIVDGLRFTTGYVPDHPGRSLAGQDVLEGTLEPWTVLAAAARETSNVRLGTKLAAVTLRHPVMLAKIIGSVDLVSSGRLTVGLGAGWLREEHQALGFPYPAYNKRLDLLEDTLALLGHLWKKEDINFAGKSLSLRAPWVFGPQPIQTPHPPIILGGWSEGRLMRLAALYADVFSVPNASPDMARQKGMSLARHCVEIGRDPETIDLAVEVFLAPYWSPREAMELVSELTSWRQAHGAPKAVASPECVLQGNAHQIIDQIRRYERAGVRELSVSCLPWVQEDLVWFSSEIIPEFG